MAYTVHRRCHRANLQARGGADGHRIRLLDIELRDNREGLDSLVEAATFDLTPTLGVVAAVLIVWSHPGRVRSEAVFAALAGTCPIPASSGNILRHRLNRGGDRRLNRALTTVVIMRMRIDPATRAYVARRRAGVARPKRSCGACNATSPGDFSGSWLHLPTPSLA